MKRTPIIDINTGEIIRSREEDKKKLKDTPMHQIAKIIGRKLGYSLRKTVKVAQELESGWRGLDYFFMDFLSTGQITHNIDAREIVLLLQKHVQNDWEVKDKRVAQGVYCSVFDTGETVDVMIYTKNDFLFYGHAVVDRLAIGEDTFINGIQGHMLIGQEGGGAVFFKINGQEKVVRWGVM